MQLYKIAEIANVQYLTVCRLVRKSSVRQKRGRFHVGDVLGLVLDWQIKIARKNGTWKEICRRWENSSSMVGFLHTERYRREFYEESFNKVEWGDDGFINPPPEVVHDAMHGVLKSLRLDLSRLKTIEPHLLSGGLDGRLKILELEALLQELEKAMPEPPEGWTPLPDVCNYSYALRGSK